MFAVGRRQLFIYFQNARVAFKVAINSTLADTGKCALGTHRMGVPQEGTPDRSAVTGTGSFGECRFQSYPFDPAGHSPDSPGKALVPPSRNRLSNHFVPLARKIDSLRCAGLVQTIFQNFRLLAREFRFLRLRANFCLGPRPARRTTLDACVRASGTTARLRVCTRPSAAASAHLQRLPCSLSRASRRPSPIDVAALTRRVTIGH